MLKLNNNRKFLIGTWITIFSLFCFLALKKEGIRYVPSLSDFSAEGGGQRYAKLESLCVEMANILPQARRISSAWRCCSLGIIYTDTIKSNPVFDSIQGTVIIVSGAGGVDIDTLKEVDHITGAPTCDSITSCEYISGATVLNDSAKIGASGNFIAQVTQSSDTLFLVIGDSTVAISVDDKYVTP